MKTIMIEDRVYDKLKSLKGLRSFSKLLDSLVEESKGRRKADLGRHFGSLKKKEAEKWEYVIRESQKSFKVRM